jgi:hypothetical protein
MKKLFFVLVLFGAAIFGAGIARGWFQFSTESADQKSKITLTVAWDKVQEDKEKASARIRNLGANTKETPGAEDAGHPDPDHQPQP